MSTTELELTVSVEAAITNALRDFLQGLLEEYGLRVTSVEVNWMDLRTVGEQKDSSLIDSMHVRTTKQFP